MINKILSDNSFHLSGSRFMNKLYPYDVILSDGTDWDFSAQYSPELTKKLLDMGFKEKTFKGEKYKCNQSVCLYEYENIDVVLRRNIQTYLEAFETMPLYDYLTKVWKSSKYFSGNLSLIREYMNERYRVVENNKKGTNQ